MIIRPFVMDKDFDSIKDWVKDERSHALWCAGRFAYPLTVENFADVLREHAAMHGDMPFAAEDGEGRVTGFFCLSYNTLTKESMLRFVIIDPARRGMGLGREMLRLAVGYAFGKTGAETVRLCVFAENTAAVKCYQNAGFIEQGTDRGAFRFGDEVWDRCRMTINKNTEGEEMR